MRRKKHPSGRVSTFVIGIAQRHILPSQADIAVEAIDLIDTEWQEIEEILDLLTTEEGRKELVRRIQENESIDILIKLSKERGSTKTPELVRKSAVRSWKISSEP